MLYPALTYTSWKNNSYKTIRWVEKFISSLPSPKKRAISLSHEMNADDGIKSCHFLQRFLFLKMIRQKGRSQLWSCFIQINVIAEHVMEGFSRLYRHMRGFSYYCVNEILTVLLKSLFTTVGAIWNHNKWNRWRVILMMQNVEMYCF